MSLREFIIGKEKLIGIIIIIAILAHILFGKPRWQLYPLYLLVLSLFIMVFYSNFRSIDISRSFDRLLTVSGLLLLFVSIILLLVFPMEKLPTPSGKYSIGSKNYDLIDRSRDDPYSEVLNGDRKIKFQIWYPTDNTDGHERAKWIEDGKILTRQLAKSMHLPSFMLDHTALIDSNSYKDAHISDDLANYPIVIISHGWLGFRELHTDFAEELASNGYIAISIDHTYGSQAVKFKDESVAYLNPEALPDAKSTSKFSEYANTLVKTYGEDVGSVLDELEVLNRDEDFKNKLNLDSIGLLGHSTGGGGDVYISLKDERIKSILGLDAWVIPIESQDLKDGLSIPSLFIRSNQWATVPNNKALKSLVKNSNDSTFIQIDKSTHVDFSMAYMYSPVTKLVGFTGRLKGRLASEIQRDFILNFFDKNLRGREDHINSIIDRYEDVRLIDRD